MISNKIIIIISLCILIIMFSYFSLSNIESFETVDKPCPHCNKSHPSKKRNDNKIAVFMYCTPNLLEKWACYSLK